MSDHVKRMSVAYQIQDACNPIAIANTLVSMAREITKEQGMSALAADPAFIIVLDKLNDLAGRPSEEYVCRCMNACAEASEGVSA
jgi:hypothetical protein